jgi:DNA topoisomerase-1
MTTAAGTKQSAPRSRTSGGRRRPPGIERIRRGRGFTYRDERTGEPPPEATLERIRSLAIPPAWRDVWISSAERAPLQALGRDARGRQQYLYHPRFRDRRSEEKYARMLSFGRSLRRLRPTVAADLRRHDLGQRRVLAAVVQLLDATAARVGNESYARENGTMGLTTLERDNVEASASTVVLDFVGKGGKHHTISLRDPRVARVLERCAELPGDAAFPFVDEDNGCHRVTSSQVNAYIREAAGGDFTAKDFRTWHGSVCAVRELATQPVPESDRQAKRAIAGAMRGVAEQLGNTPAVCRASYVHPGILEAFSSGLLQEGWRANGSRWQRLPGDPSERHLLWLLGRE